MVVRFVYGRSSARTPDKWRTSIWWLSSAGLLPYNGTDCNDINAFREHIARKPMVLLEEFVPLKNLGRRRKPPWHKGRPEENKRKKTGVSAVPRTPGAPEASAVHKSP